MTDQNPKHLGHRALGAEAIKGLAHPLRVQLLNALATFGPATASGLADRLGESSGATSYHLRQLEKHGFVYEDASRSSGRERWWERTPDGLILNVTDFEPDSAERAIAQTIEREWDRSRAAALDEFGRRGAVELPKDWYDSSLVATINMQLTRDELDQFVDELEVVTKRWVSSHKKAKPGSRPVQTHLNVFPVLGGHETPNGSDSVGGQA